MNPKRAKIQHFLLVFDHNQGRLLELIEFGDDSERAVEAYTAKERDFQGQRRIEIVLIGSDTIDTVKRTHANYFEQTDASSKYFDLAGLR